MIEQLPVIPVVSCLCAAALCLLLRNHTLIWSVSALTGLLNLVCAILLLQRVNSMGEMSYHLGGWAPPWGIEYRVDALAVVVLLVVSGVAAAVLLFARGSFEREIPSARTAHCYAAMLLSLAGFQGIVLTGDVFNLFVFFEIAALSSYALISLGEGRRALMAAFQYFINGSVGATFLLTGIGLLYLQTGTLNMTDLATRLPPLAASPSIQMAFVFVTLGLGLKLALFPLHLWLPGAYSCAPSAVAVMLAAFATKVAFYALLRFYFDIFGVGFSLTLAALQYVLLPLSMAAIFVGSTAAIFEPDIKRMMAWSGIASIGYMVLTGSLASQLGLQASLIQFFNHALITGSLFMALGCVWYRLGSVQLVDMAGLGRRMPLTMAAFVVAGLGLIGIPLTAGFISKWYLLLAVLETRSVLLPALLIAALLALIYVGRVIETAYFKSPAGRAVAVIEAPARLLVPTWLLVAASVYFGIDSSLITGVAAEAAASLLTVPP